MFKYVTLVLVSVFLVSCSFLPNADAVAVSGRQVLVNNKPFIIKGICYTPVAKGSNNPSFEHLSTDLALMKEAGINTIRVYKPIDDIAILDKINSAGIKLIVSFGYNQDGYYDMLSGSFIDYVNKYKSHDVILFWELGNEFNYHPEWFEGDIRNWYKALNNAADLIHGNDQLHPVSTAHGELPGSLAMSMCKSIDVWGMNVYRWDNPEGIFKQWSDISEKPMYLAEAGADSYMSAGMNGYEQGPNEKAQADATGAILDDIFKSSDICAGVCVFAFVDEWWKAGNPNAQDAGGWAPNSSAVPYDGTPNEEYWGIVDIDRNKKLAFDVVKNRFKK